ncbi:retrovirus-related pol polyprotein from transposon TNT 1-94 [Tanacetum coccineum]
MSLSLAENVIVAAADNRPPMLDKTQYNSWASRMKLYIKGKENGKLLVSLVLNGPFKYGTVTEAGTATIPATVRDRRYDELTDAKKIPPVANHSLVVHHQSYQAPNVHQPSQASFPLMDSGLVVPSFLPSEDPIVNLNKAMAFISTAFTSRYPPTNKQLRTSSNPRNQATIQDGRVQVQTVQGRQNQRYAGSGARSNATTTGVNRTGGTNTAGQVKVIHCYNCQEEGHMARQCTKPKRPRNSAWFKEKVMLAEALESGVILDEEQMTFLADNKDTVTTGQQSQEIPTLTTFQTDDLDAFDFDCDEAPSASDVLMAKLSSYDSVTLSKLPIHVNYLDNYVIDQNMQEMQYSEQSIFNNDIDIDITSDSNMISYEQYLKETKNTV